MTTEPNASKSVAVPADVGATTKPPRLLTPAAERALAEAAERRRRREATEQGQAAEDPKEHGGRSGPDPVRYGDWENGGIASDF